MKKSKARQSSKLDMNLVAGVLIECDRLIRALNKRNRQGVVATLEYKIKAGDYK